ERRLTKLDATTALGFRAIYTENYAPMMRAAMHNHYYRAREDKDEIRDHAAQTQHEADDKPFPLTTEDENEDNNNNNNNESKVATPPTLSISVSPSSRGPRTTQ